MSVQELIPWVTYTVKFIKLVKAFIKKGSYIKSLKLLIYTLQSEHFKFHRAKNVKSNIIEANVGRNISLCDVFLYICILFNFC